MDYGHSENCGRKEEMRMASAVCPHCGETAYSSAEFVEPWTCPTCKQVVVPELTPEDRERVGETVIEKYSRFWSPE